MVSLQTIERYWGRAGLAASIIEALRSTGAALDRLTVEDLAPFDQFHGGGLEATLRLARLARMAAGLRVLDVGGGLGGPARTLAARLGCSVTVLDLAASYVEAGAALTSLLRLGDRVSHCAGSALELPFADASFDVVWTQNSSMNIADKAALVAGFHRVLRAGGRYVFQEPMAGPVQPPIYPLMWAADASTDFLLAPAQVRLLLEEAGFAVQAWSDVTAEASGGKPPAHGQSIQSLVMGEKRLAAIARAGRRNRDEGRVVMIQAVCARR